MRTEQPNVIHLKDYQAPDYLIDETALTFELHEDHTLVHAQLVMRRNPERADGTLPALVLDGQQLELLSLSMDDRELGAADYQLTDSHLTLQPVAEQFTLDSTVRIHPESNTALEGLYKSGKMFCTASTVRPSKCSSRRRIRNTPRLSSVSTCSSLART